MTLLTRSALVLGCLAAAMASHAQEWGTSRFVRIGDDRVVVFSKGSTYDLQRDAAWDIADAGQKSKFDAWVKAAGLPKDPGQFVADLPASRQVPLGAEIQVGAPTSAGATLALKLETATPVRVSVLDTTHWDMATNDRPAFEEFASKLKTSVPTLLVALSGLAKPTESAAWQKLVERSGAPGGFVTLLGGAKVALWTHRAEGLAAPIATAKPKTAVPNPAPSPSPAWLLPAVGGGVVVIIGGVVFGVPSVRSRVLGAAQKPAAATFPVGSHERELILKVREEGRRKPPNNIHSEEEFAVGMMLDRYNGYGTLSQELERANKRAEALAAYKEYQTQFEEFEKRYSAATNQVAQLKDDSAKQQKIQSELKDRLKRAETNVKDLMDEQAQHLQALADADALLKETGEWCKAVTERLNAQAAKIHYE